MPLDLLEKELDGAFADPFNRLRHCGQRRATASRIIVVVESDHGDVFGDAQVAVQELAHSADGHLVVGRNQGVDAARWDPTLVEKCADGAAAGLFEEIAGKDQLLYDGYAQPFQRGPEDGLSVRAVRIPRGATDESDAQMAMVGDQVLDDGRETAYPVDDNVWKAGQLAHAHDGEAPSRAKRSNRVGAHCARQDGGHHDEPIEGWGGRQIVEERAVEPCGWRTLGTKEATRKADEICASLACEEKRPVEQSRLEARQ
jgi:hypothetical protein